MCVLPVIVYVFQLLGLKLSDIFLTIFNFICTAINANDEHRTSSYKNHKNKN